MNPTEYEHHVAAILRAEGWNATVTPPAGDGGVDVIAEKDGVRLAVQAKMYGTSARAVNSQIVHELYGAAVCKDCTQFMIATDGRVRDDARDAAAKLAVQIRHVAAVTSETGGDGTAERQHPTFGSVWRQVAALEGRTLVRKDGTANQVLAVDGAGVVRLTSKGTKQRLEIEIFRWTIERLLAGEVVTLSEINDHWIKRGSSGILLILSSLDVFESITVRGRKALRLAAGAQMV